MKNVLLLVVDSMSSQYYKDDSFDVMPFLTWLKQHAIVYNNIYSQAPYTEAATMNLYCGQDVLQNSGYMRRFKYADKTIFEAFKENGYITYFNSLQPQCYPSSLCRGIDDIRYSVGYEPNVLWNYRLKYFSELFRNCALTEKDYAVIEDMVDDNLREWLLFVERIISDDPSVQMIKNNTAHYNASEAWDIIHREISAFDADRKAYINKVLSQGTENGFFTIPAFFQDAKIKDKEYVLAMQKKWKKTFKVIRKKHRGCNRKKFFLATGIIFKNLLFFITHPSKSNFKELLKTTFTVYDSIYDFDLRERIKDDYASFKNAPSMYTHFNDYLSWLDCYDGEAPYFACIHIDDIHNPEIFFTYDTVDKELNDSELGDVLDVLSHLPKTFDGSVTHQLSLRYADSKLKYLFYALKECGRLQDTLFVVTADHGFSFSGSPLRSSTILNFYLENYKIPFVIYDGYHSMAVNELFSSKDIPSTLLSILDFQVPKSFKGKKFLENGNPILRIQYCGGGCPDISRREMFLAAFDDKYFISVKSKLNETVTFERLFEIYDLKNDKYQIKNLIKMKCIKREDIQHLIDDINQQLQEIKNTQKELS